MKPEFGFLQFQQTDSVFHERPGDKAAIEAVYRAVDRQLEETLAETDPDNVLVVSDHGIGPVSGLEFRINEFLRDRGYLTAQNGGEECPTGLVPGRTTSRARTRVNTRRLSSNER